jgi:TrmH family RNA methyltransferase
MSATVRVTSRQHDSVRRLRRAAGGDDACVLLDGAHVLDEALRSRVPLELVLSDGHWPDLETRAAAAGAAVYIGTHSVLDAASPVRSPTGIVALARWRPAAVSDALASAPACALGLVGVQDPGNVGAAIRAADALDGSGVLALDDTADPSGWKAIRGAMGSTFHVPVARGATLEAVAEARRRQLVVVAAVAGDGVPVDRANLGSPMLILVGSEGAGLPEAVRAQADALVTIPMRAGVDSLNVAVTCALLLFEARRQRAALSSGPAAP